MKKKGGAEIIPLYPREVGICNRHNLIEVVLDPAPLPLKIFRVSPYTIEMRLHPFHVPASNPIMPSVWVLGNRVIGKTHPGDPGGCLP